MAILVIYVINLDSHTQFANTVFIKTAFSRWIIFIDDYHVTRVKHENYKNQWRNSQKKCIENYHTHNLKTTSFYDVACYIKDMMKEC